MQANTMSNENGFRNNNNRRSSGRIQKGCTIISDQSSSVHHRMLSKQLETKKHSRYSDIPSTILIPSSSMMDTSQNNPKKRTAGETKSDRRSKARRVVEDGPTAGKTIENLLKELEQRLTGNLNTLEERLTGNLNTLEERLTGNLNTLEEKLNKLEQLALIDHPHEDKYWQNVHVEQYIERSSATWTVMKIKMSEEREQCIAVTSAHLMTKIQQVRGKNYAFVVLPKHLREAGTEWVMLHEQVLNPERTGSIKYWDLIIIGLKNIPKINGRSPEMDDLPTYPKKTASYQEWWRQKDVIGRSRRGFVTGQGVRNVTEKKNSFYQFTAKSGEKGDSGTLLYVNGQELGKKDLVGLFKGILREKDMNPVGIITPAIGWGELTKLQVVKSDPGIYVLDKGKRVTFRYGKGDIRHFRYEIIDPEHGRYNLIHYCKHENDIRIYGTIFKIPQDKLLRLPDIPENKNAVDGAADEGSDISCNDLDDD